jgi:hypothetical protein
MAAFKLYTLLSRHTLTKYVGHIKRTGEIIKWDKVRVHSFLDGYSSRVFVRCTTQKLKRNSLDN